MTSPAAVARRRHLILAYPLALFTLGFILPIATMIAISFFRRTQTSYEAGFEPDQYWRALDPLYLNAMRMSLEFSFLSATIALALAFPFVYIMAGFSRRVQTILLVVVLGILSLSEVIIAFSWSTFLSRPAGISNLFVALGLMDRPTSWARGYGALLASLSYFNISFAILILYPHCTRLDPSFVEAARTMGASPIRGILSVVLPILRLPLVTAWLALFVFTMGAIVTPQWLGEPQHWMIAVHIGKQVQEVGNVPFAAALSVIFFCLTAAIVLLTRATLGRSKGSPS